MIARVVLAVLGAVAYVLVGAFAYIMAMLEDLKHVHGGDCCMTSSTHYAQTTLVVLAVIPVCLGVYGLFKAIKAADGPNPGDGPRSGP